MKFKNLITFLEELNRNNSREWMDHHRSRYHVVRDDFIGWLEQLDLALAAIDRTYYPTPGWVAINRINNNLMFHPGRPVYKDHFGAALDKAPGSADFYLEIGIGGSLFAGGFWRPEGHILKSIRDAIDFEGERLIRIMDDPSFAATFGGLYEDEKLKTTPKGFRTDHPNIALLRHKTFAVIHRIPNEVVLREDFMEKVLSIYKEMLPFRRWLNKAVSV